MSHASVPEKTLREWVYEYIIEKCKGQAYWNSSQACWVVISMGDHVERKLLTAGFEIEFPDDRDPTLQSVLSVDELVTPISRLSQDGIHALVLPRLFGYEKTKAALGLGSGGAREHKRFVIPASDAIHRGAPRTAIQWEPNIIEAAKSQLGRKTVSDHLVGAVAAAGSAKDILELKDSDIQDLIKGVGDIPAWFGLNLYPFQRIGAIAVAAGHNCLFDEPGLGKTRQAIAAAAVVGAERTLVTCLPVGLTGWANEVTESGLHTLGGRNPDGKVVIIRSGRKEPETLPDKGVVICSDSLLNSRPELLRKVIAWEPDVLAYDEAHRGKSFESARSRTMLAVAFAAKKLAVPMTGTPVLANPAELAPLLQMSGHLGPVFGGLDAYLDRYCQVDYFGSYRVRKEHLPELRQKLIDHVWTRRRKRDVLPDLPKTQQVGVTVDVPLTEYRKAHKEAITLLTKWVTEYRKNNDGEAPDEDTIKEFAATQVGLVSLLRKAAGLAKIDVIVDNIRSHVNDTKTIRNGKDFYPRPLIVWTHHREVSDAMAAAVPNAVAGAGIIRGGVGHNERNRLVTEFQAGNIPVLVCSIAAAGVAITLTAASDMFFAESDWTPAAVRQAMDRAERIGQKSEQITSVTYLAAGTLDTRIQQVLKKKAETLDALFGEGNDVSVVDDSTETESATAIITDLINGILRGEKDTNRAAAATK